jgi:hypothetical protein
MTTTTDTNPAEAVARAAAEVVEARREAGRVRYFDGRLQSDVGDAIPDPRLDKAEFELDRALRRWQGK